MYVATNQTGYVMEEKENGRHSCKIKCHCCGRETLAEIRDDKMVIMDRRHGKKHIVVLTLKEILEKMRIPVKLGMSRTTE